MQKLKIELDLEEIFETDEDGNATIQSSVKDTIIKAVVDKLYRSVGNQLNGIISGLIETAIREKLYPAIDKVIDGLMDYEFTETSRYGSTQKPITVKNRILEDIQKALVWKDGNWDSDKSVYTKTIQRLVDSKLAEFAKQYQKEIDTKFIAAAFDHATKKLSERIGLKEDTNLSAPR